MLTCLSDFIEMKKKWKNKQINIFNINLGLTNNCIINNHSKLKHIPISQIINHNMSKKKNTTINKFIYLEFEGHIGKMSFN